MSDELNFSFEIDPNFRRSLTAEQQATLEKIERLGELDPELTERLARALDRLQRTQPYQELGRRPKSTVTPKEVNLPELSDAERAAREEFISQQLSSLLAVAGRLSQALEADRPKIQADRHFRDRLKAELKK